MNSNDPFSIVYDSLWGLVERNRELRNYLPVGNRIKFDNQNPIKQVVSDADRPEMILAVTGGQYNIKNTNTTTSVLRNYNWVLTTSTLITHEYNRITFELLRSMVDYDKCLCALQWCDCNFVQNVKLVTSDDGPELQRLLKGLTGWAGIWTIEVDMVFQTDKLRINP